MRHLSSWTTEKLVIASDALRSVNVGINPFSCTRTCGAAVDQKFYAGGPPALGDVIVFPDLGLGASNHGLFGLDSPLVLSFEGCERARSTSAAPTIAGPGPEALVDVPFVSLPGHGTTIFTQDPVPKRLLPVPQLQTMSK